MKFSHKKNNRIISPAIHDFGYVLSKNYWIFIITILFFLLVIPFATAGLPGDSIFEIEVTHEQLKFRLIHEDVLAVVLAGCVIFGMISGISHFRFMQDKKETTIFFSMGMTRGQLFRNRCISGMGMLTVGIAIPMLISMALNIKALGLYQSLIRNTVYLIVGLCLTACVSFLVTVIVSALSGTVVETILYWCSLMATPFVICYGGNQLLKTLFWGNSWGVTAYTQTDYIRPNLADKFSWLNPCSFFYDELKTHAQFMRPLSSAIPPQIELKVLIGWCVALGLLFVLALFLIKRRVAEIAGISGTNPCLLQWLMLITSFLVFACAFSFLYSFSVKLAWLLATGGLAAVHLFWRKSLFSFQMQRKKSFGVCAIQFCICAVICIILSQSVSLGVERYLEKGQIAKAEVSYVGAPGDWYGTSVGSSTGRTYYLTGEMSFEEQAEIEQVAQIQKLFLTTGKMEMATDEENFSNTVVPYDVIFRYTDVKGEEHVWYYDRASLSQLEQLLELEDADTFQNGQNELFDDTLDNTDEIVWSNEAYWKGTVYLTDRFCSQTYEMSLTEEQRQELLFAIGKDRENTSVSERYFPDGKTKAVLMFSGNGEYDCEHYAYNLDNAFVYVNESDVQTLKWLEDNQLLNLVTDSPQIESITLQKFDPYIGINGLTSPISLYFMSYRADSLDEFLIQKDFGKKYTITDADKLAELAPVLKNGYFMSEGGYLAAVKLTGIDGYIYMFLPAADLPDFVKG
jgi:ABC-2 type transport system permease protein